MYKYITATTTDLYRYSTRYYIHKRNGNIELLLPTVRKTSVCCLGTFLVVLLYVPVGTQKWPKTKG